MRLEKYIFVSLIIVVNNKLLTEYLFIFVAIFVIPSESEHCKERGLDNLVIPFSTV